MTKRIALVAFLVCTMISTALAEEAPPAPSFDRVRYDRPDHSLELNPSLGSAERIRAAAAPLKRTTPEKTLAAIHKWVNAELKYDANAAYVYRDFDQACDAKLYGGCADYAVVFTALSRACGIPTVFVKTMDADWIREFRAGGKPSSWRGHVFLEVFVDGKWKLLEPGEPRIYEDYDPKTRRLLPGERWAYDKGADPKEIVLSLDWERWKIQTAAHFKDFDLAQLPPGVGDRGRAIAEKKSTSPPTRPSGRCSMRSWRKRATRSDRSTRTGTPNSPPPRAVTSSSPASASVSFFRTDATTCCRSRTIRSRRSWPR